MTTDEALKLLRGGPEGVKKWNQWRKENPYAEIPNLEKAQLRDALLRDADLHKVNLAGADLRNADLRNADLHEAHLEGADFLCAHLEEANFCGAHLEGAYLTLANLKGANLGIAHLEGAKLVWARLDGATFLVEGGRGRFWDTLWPWYPFPYTLDRNHTRNTHFPRRARDPWSVLRRSYTGPNLVFVLLFTLAAFLPVIAKATLWSAVSRWQETAAPVAIDAVQRMSEFLAKTPDPAWTPWVEKAQAFLSSVERERMTRPQVRETLELLLSGAAAIEAFGERASKNAAELEGLRQVENWVAQAQEAVRILAPDGELRLQERRVFSLVLATDDGWHIASLSALLLLYNLARAFLTYSVGPLRDDEERVGVSPAWDDYKRLWRLHQLASPVLAVAVIFGVVRIGGMLWRTVLVPG